MIDLKSIKKRMKAVSSDSDLNASTMVALSKDSDCFAKLFDETDKTCLRCNVLIEFDGKRESLSVFCKQFSGEVDTNEPNEPIIISDRSHDSKEEKNMTEEAVDTTTRKRYTEPEIAAILDLKNAGKTFEEIQVAIKEQFKVDRPTRALKIIYDRHSKPQTSEPVPAQG